MSKMILRLYFKPGNIKKLVTVEDSSQSFDTLLDEASKSFGFPPYALVFSVNQQKVDLAQPINEYCQNGSIITVDTDFKNMKQNEQKLIEQKLNKAIENNPNVESMFNFLAQNSDQKLVKAYLYACQEKIAYAMKIVIFTHDLENAQVNELEQQESQITEQIMDKKLAEKAVMNAEEQIKKDMEENQEYPDSYLNFNKQTKDQVLQFHEILRISKLDLSSAHGMPISLISTQQLKPTRARESDDDTYELDQLQSKNINTVLIENLLTEIAVMYKFLTYSVEQIKQQTKFNSWQEQDQAEDILNLYKNCQSVISQLIDTKDMLLGQYLLKSKKLDQQKAKQGFQAYLDQLEKVYNVEFKQLQELIDQPFDKSEALQALEKFNGSVSDTIDFLLGR